MPSFFNEERFSLFVSHFRDKPEIDEGRLLLQLEYNSKEPYIKQAARGIYGACFMPSNSQHVATLESSLIRFFETARRIALRDNADIYPNEAALLNAIENTFTQIELINRPQGLTYRDKRFDGLSGLAAYNLANIIYNKGYLPSLDALANNSKDADIRKHASSLWMGVTWILNLGRVDRDEETRNKTHETIYQNLNTGLSGLLRDFKRLGITETSSPAIYPAEKRFFDFLRFALLEAQGPDRAGSGDAPSRL